MPSDLKYIECKDYNNLVSDFLYYRKFTLSFFLNYKLTYKTLKDWKSSIKKFIDFNIKFWANFDNFYFFV